MTDVGGGIPVEFRILGPLEVLIGGEVVDLGTAKQRALLALLVMHANQVVATERLVEDIWGEQPPARAANAVQVYVSYLRKVLEPDRAKGGESHLLLTRRPGYLLRAEPDQVDSLRFERLVDEGRRALAAGNPEAAARRLRQGLELWRGPALADVAYEPFADREAGRLEELRVAAIEDRVEADLARGLHSDLVAELDALVGAHPLRERLWGQRMVALYRCGRQAEALRAYRDLREALAEELGIDPSPALQRLEEAILQQREELAWTHAGGELGPTAAAVPDLPGGVVSFLLTDIVSSTSLWEEHPDAMAQALARHDALVAELVDNGGGWLIKSKGEGDATLSVFVRASDAVATALALQRAIAAEPWTDDLDLTVRIGVHTGEAQLRDGDYFGPTLNRAARIRALAGRGQVLLSQATAELVAERLPSGASLRALGQHTLRGLARPEHVFALAHADLDTSDLPFGDQAVPSRPGEEAPRRHNLPVSLTSFVGRADARAELSALLAHDRLVTLTGPGGAGKTRLAAQVALDNLSRWPDGAWMVELAGLSDPRMVTSAVAGVVGVAEQAGRSLVDGLVDALRGRRMLLVFDNCEHVIDAVADLVDQLLVGCPQVDVLATSRQQLGLDHEVTWAVPSLAVPPPMPAGEDVEKLLGWDSVQLFLDRARLSNPRFDPSEAELRAVGDVCRRLDGIPLAIELAAARTRDLTPAQIVARLDDAFELLTSGSRSALPRQQTLRALVDWSHHLLSAEEQAVFRRLAVFAGPISFDGAQAVVDDPGAGEVLADLVDKSLVVQESGGTRFRLLETIRQYAYEKLRAAGEESTFRSRHRDWVVGLVEQAQPALDAGGDTGWHDRLEEELDNIRTALEWSLAERDGREAAARLAAAANGFWVARHWSEGRHWLERALVAPGDITPACEAAARNSAANLAGLQGDFDAARHMLEGSIELGRQLGDDVLVREALHVLGNVTWDHGDFAGAVESYAQALEIARRLDDKRAVARALTNMGALAAWRGDQEAATAQCEEALAIARQLGEGLIVRGALINLAYVLLHQGDRSRPHGLLTEVLDLARREGHTYDVMIAEGALADVAIADGDLVGARARLEVAIGLARQLGDKSALPELLNSFGRVLHDERDYAASAEAQHEAFELASQTNQQLFRAQAVEGLAAVAVALGDATAAARMLGAADAVRAEIGCPFPPFACHVDRSQVVAAGEAALGAEAWSTARLLGSALTLDAALTDAERPAAEREGGGRAARVGEVFVGRGDELALLRNAWAGALSGHRQVVLLAGEPGIGKTRLAAEFAAGAADDGAIVLQGRCEEEMLVPYQPFVEVLRQYVVDAPIAQLETHAARAGELARLVPELGERILGLPAPRSADPETERFRLFEAVADLLEAASTSAPILVVLDDLQWADRSALLLLKYLARGRGSARVMLLGTYRDTELDRQHPLWETVADLRREPHFTRLALAGLDRDSVAELLRVAGHVGDERTRAGLAGILRQETAGNPFFVGEIVRHLLESGAEVEAAGVAVPEGVRDVIGRRLARLSPAANAALMVAAVIGDTFEIPVLEQACELSDDSVLEALDEAAAAHLLEEQPDLDTYAFCHSLVRSAILEELSASRRARLHRRVGLVLEGIYTGDADAHLSNLASRFAKSPVATDWPKALDYARRAADRAVAQLAYETAADQYARAIELLERQESAEDLRIELLLAMGDAHNRAGQDDAAKAAFMEAADLARATGRTVALAKAAIGFCGQLRIGFDVEDPRAVALLEEALTAIGDNDTPERAIALSRLALARYRSGAQAERRWQVDEALDVARRLDPATLAAVLVSRHWTLYGPDDLEERVAVATELAALGEELGDVELVLHARQAQVHDSLELGRSDEVRAAVAERDRLADELRHPYYLWSVLVTRALDAATEGRFEEAEALASQALHYRVEHDVQQAFTVHSAQFLQVLWLQGRLGELDPGWVRRSGWDPESPRALYLLTWMAAGAGRLDDAALHLEAILAKGLDSIPRNIEWFVAMAALADACDVLRHDKAALRLYELLLPYEARNCAVGQSAFYGAAAHWLGVLAGVLDRHDDAIRHLRDGLARHEAMNAPPFVALSQAALARALRRRGADGDAAEAEALDAQARATAEQLGMRGLLAAFPA